MVIERLPQIVQRRSQESPAPHSSDDPAIRAMLADSLSELSRGIYEGSKDRVEYKDMGATAVCALVTSHHAHIAHMGDSRAYLFRAGELRQLTEDHSIVGLLVQHGEITAQEAEDHPARGRLTRYVGMEAAVDPEVQTIELHPGDRLLLCTDGLWGMLPHSQLREILAERNDPEITCRTLVTAGKKAGGQDNLTAVIIDSYESEFRDGEIIYHEYPPPRRLRKVMSLCHAMDLIERGMFYMSNQNVFRHAPPGPRRDEKDGTLEYRCNGVHFTVHGGNLAHVWCATTEKNPQTLFSQWADCDTVVEISDCAELFRRAKNACMAAVLGAASP